MEEDRLGVLEREAHEPMGTRRLLRAASRLGADEVLLQLHDVSEAGRERVVRRTDVVPDVDEPLLDPE